MRTVSSYREMLQNYRGCAARPDVFDVFWAQTCSLNEPEVTEVQKAPVSSASLVCEEFTCRASDDVFLKVHTLRPAGATPRPTVVLYTDLGRKARGWLHLARFASLGFVVVAPETRELPAKARALFEKAWKGEVSAPELAAYGFGTSATRVAGAEGAPAAMDMAGAEGAPAATDTAITELARATPLFQLISDAYAVACAAQSLPYVAADCLMTWGEGLGGTLALDIAALLGPECAGMMAQNPFFADSVDIAAEKLFGAEAALKNAQVISAFSLLDTTSFAEKVTCPTLMACSLEDQASPPEGTFAAYNRIPATCKRIAVYPKHAHERINDFENLQIDFLLTRSGGRL